MQLETVCHGEWCVMVDDLRIFCTFCELNDSTLSQIVNIRAAQLVAVCIDWTSTKGLNFFALMVLSLTTKLVLGVRVNYMLIVIF